MKLNRKLAVASAVIALGASIVVGCNSTTPEAESNSGSAQSDTPTVTAVDYTNEKGELICPVLGDVISSKEAAAGHQEYKGKTYYFCCAGCPEKFAADPEKYAK
jgi:Cu+-exporting ATPase